MLLRLCRVLVLSSVHTLNYLSSPVSGNCIPPYANSTSVKSFTTSPVRLETGNVSTHTLTPSTTCLLTRPLSTFMTSSTTSSTTNRFAFFPNTTSSTTSPSTSASSWIHMPLSSGTSPITHAPSSPTSSPTPTPTPTETPKAQIKVGAVQCNSESDFPGHADIDPFWVSQNAITFCGASARPATLRPATPPVVATLQDNVNVNYGFSVGWAAGCVLGGRGDQEQVQNLISPTGSANETNCAKVMWENYRHCNNGGVGGKTQVGCLVYAFDGGK
ncbi:hypothetical protein F4677DRAFT_422453 [Hypoxylon crocopeplum]|nr:hypothetical protein F4677DRAFT_422453 [Hypoxylon crocopeplum]